MASNPVSYFTGYKQQELPQDDAPYQLGSSPYNPYERTMLAFGEKHDSSQLQKSKNNQKGSKNARGGGSDSINIGSRGTGGIKKTTKSYKHHVLNRAASSEGGGAEKSKRSSKTKKQSSRMFMRTKSEMSDSLGVFGELEADGSFSAPSLDGYSEEQWNSAQCMNVTNGVIEVRGMSMNYYLKDYSSRTVIDDHHTPHTLQYTNISGKQISYKMDKATNRGVFVARVGVDKDTAIDLPIVPHRQLQTDCCYHINWMKHKLVDIEDSNGDVEHHFGGSGVHWNEGNEFFTDKSEPSSLEDDPPLNRWHQPITPTLNRNASIECGPLTIINISHNQIVNVPTWLFLLPFVTHIDLSHNAIQDLPAYASFPVTPHALAPRLRSLYLGSNNFSVIPLLLSHLPHLEELDLSDLGRTSLRGDDWNKFRFTEATVSRCSINALNLANNNLATVPAFCFSDLTTLQHLKLGNNAINSLPSEMVQLSSLMTLDLSDNKLKSLEHINQTDHSKLVTLRASRNEISDVSLLLLACPALKLLDLSSNVIQAFSDLHLLKLECLDSKSKTPRWCDVAVSKKTETCSNTHGRDLKVLVGDNLPEMEPPAYAFENSSVLKLFLNELRTVGPFLEQYRKHAEQLEISKQALRNIKRIEECCCGALAHPIFGESLSLSTSLAGGKVRFYLCTTASVTALNELTEKAAATDITLTGNIIAVHNNDSIDVEMCGGRVLSGWLGEVGNKPILSTLVIKCGDQLSLSNRERHLHSVKTPLSPPPSLFKNKQIVSGEEENTDSPTKLRQKKKKEKDTSRKSRKLEGVPWYDVPVELVSGMSSITFPLHIPFPLQDSMSGEIQSKSPTSATITGVHESLARSAAKCFKFDSSFDSLTVVFRSLETMEILNSDESLMAALHDHAKNSMPAAPRTPTRPQSPRAPLTPPSPLPSSSSATTDSTESTVSDSFLLVESRKQKKKKDKALDKTSTSGKAAVEELTPLILPVEASSSAVASSSIVSPKPSRGSMSSRGQRSPPPTSPSPSVCTKPFRMMVWIEKNKERTGGETHISAQEVAGSMVKLCEKCCSNAHQLLLDASSALDPDIELLAFFSAPRVDPDDVNGVRTLGQLPLQRELKSLLTEVASSVVVPAARFPKDVRDFLGGGSGQDRGATKLGARYYSPRCIQFSGHGKDTRSAPMRRDTFVMNTEQEKESPSVSFACPLIFEEGTPSMNEFIDVLRHCIRLEGVFLNACETGKYAEMIGKELPDVAVVAWKGSTSESEAYIWSKHFYKELGKQVGRSFEEAYDAALITYKEFWSGKDAQNVLRKLRKVDMSSKPVLLEPLLVRRKGHGAGLVSKPPTKPSLLPATNALGTPATRPLPLFPLELSSSPPLTSPKPSRVGLLAQELSRSTYRSQSAPVDTQHN